MDIVRDPGFFSTVAHMATNCRQSSVYDFHESSLLGNWNLLGWPSSGWCQTETVEGTYTRSGRYQAGPGVFWLCERQGFWVVLWNVWKNPETWGFMIQFDFRIFFRWVGEKPPKPGFVIYPMVLSSVARLPTHIHAQQQNQGKLILYFLLAAKTATTKSFIGIRNGGFPETYVRLFWARTSYK